MATVKDPVCGMMIEPEPTAATSTFNGQTYYFCAVSCKHTFDKNPLKFVPKP